MKDKKKQQDMPKSELKVDRATLNKFSRGTGLTVKTIKATKDKKTKGYLKTNEEKIKAAALLATKAKLLQVEEPGYIEAEGLEKTWKFQQEDIAKQVPLASAYKHFDLKLQFGPYALDYGRSGRNLLIGGSKGHVAAFDWKTGKLLCETQLQEKVHAVKWLHQDSLYAVAQKKHVFIYDVNGLEIHALRNHEEATLLDFLPFHMLLVSSGKYGALRYQDISTGELVAELKTKLGSTYSMRQNPTNAIMHLGHNDGTVTLWSPNLTKPLVKMFCHKGPVQSLAVDGSGRYMVTSGLDAQLKVWDARTYRMLDNYYTPLAASSVDISQLGMLAVSFGATVNVWKDTFTTKQKDPYLRHCVEGALIGMTRFCPFDDVLGLGHTRGMSSMLVPGAGEPNFDSLEANPFQTKKQRQEATVKSLLDKIQPDTIALDTDYFGRLQLDHATTVAQARSQSRQANGPEGEGESAETVLNEASTSEARQRRGRSSTLRRYLKKQQNVVDARKQAILAQLELKKQKKLEEASVSASKPRSALDRFKPKTTD